MSCLFINSLCLGCNTSVDIVGVDDDPSLFENGTVAWLLFSLGMCNAISMSFGVGKPPTARQISWAGLRKYSYCLGLTGRHHPHQGRHPVSHQPCQVGLPVNRLQLIHCDASTYDVLHLRTVINLISLSTP